MNKLRSSALLVAALAVNPVAGCRNDKANNANRDDFPTCAHGMKVVGRRVVAPPHTSRKAIECAEDILAGRNCNHIRVEARRRMIVDIPGRFWCENGRPAPVPDRTGVHFDRVAQLDDLQDIPSQGDCSDVRRDFESQIRSALARLVCSTDGALYIDRESAPVQ